MRDKLYFILHLTINTTDQVGENGFHLLQLQAWRSESILYDMTTYKGEVDGISQIH